ncbi:uncharacterized protein RSE6_09749 [Rhynchosporium secalis]|uniref:Uncharacterized protein n=1 Tax=Rhynchosporium secalis TaxID=38038 RepID=A0A1E1MIS1_RHYSE|nr:uncharacterized protein RSE6_09749 [Rhynchosporium secalis]
MTETLRSDERNYKEQCGVSKDRNVPPDTSSGCRFMHRSKHCWDEAKDKRAIMGQILYQKENRTGDFKMTGSFPAYLNEHHLTNFGPSNSPQPSIVQERFDLGELLCSRGKPTTLRTSQPIGMKWEGSAGDYRGQQPLYLALS